MGEGRNAYIDRPALRVVLLTRWVCCASALDAYLTLCSLQEGGQEANPLMALALAHGDTVFLWGKIGLTSLRAWLLAAHQQFPLAYTGWRGLAGRYSFLLGSPLLRVCAAWVLHNRLLGSG